MAALEAETAGNERLSLWIAFDYGGRAELVFVETLWPDFGEDDLRRALADYATRRRRFGGR